MNLDKAHIERIAGEAIAGREDLFVLQVQVSPSADIVVTLDGDNGATLGECIEVSRYIESALEETGENFSLRVETPDITKAFSHPRQFRKNIGRILKIKTQSGSYEGKLDKIDRDELYISWKTREDKPIGKGKHTVEKQAVIPIGEIIEAKVKIQYHS